MTFVLVKYQHTILDPLIFGTMYELADGLIIL
jgi:hypothetical protein